LSLISDPHTGTIRWQHTVTVSKHFAAVIDKMLRPVPEDRYLSVELLERALKLEPHLDTLSACMNKRERPPVDVSLEEPPMNGYLTPIQREARAIRRWRSKRLVANPSHRPAGPL
jgi:serine/threonine protein kinase